MTPRPATFAIPGDPDRRTGGFIYERRLLAALRAGGRRVARLELGASFPDPTEADMADAVARLCALDPAEPVILDGFLVGALDTAGLARVRAPICAVVHHPLGMETGLAPERAAELLAREAANLALAAHVVVPSPHMAEILRTRFGVAGAAITVAPPGFDRSSAVATPGPAAAAPLILSVGLLAERKGHDVLLRALARLADLPWRAEIVGPVHDDAVAGALKRLRDDLGLGGRVTFAGLVPDARLAELYAGAHLFALATRFEGYGMAFAEALMHGLPIVTCRSGAVPDTVPAGAGRLVAPEDPGAFAAALRELLAEPHAYAGAAAVARAAGAALPGWADTAAAVSRVLDRIAPSV